MTGFLVVGSARPPFSDGRHFYPADKEGRAAFTTPMQNLHILKIGGKVIEDGPLLDTVLQKFAGWTGPRILVHGGGKRTDQLCNQLDIEPRMHAGRRITCADTLEVVAMVYAGLLNKQIVSRLQAQQVDAIGLSGADGNTIRASKRVVGAIDYGYAGDIEYINTDSIERLLSAGLSPVFCAITHDGSGQLLNTNADTIAARLAMALAGSYQVKLHYCFEKNGVLLDPNGDHSVIHQLNPQEYQQYQASGAINEGMIPKLDNAFAALDQKVAEVFIAGPETLGKGGTKIVKGEGY